MSHDQRLQSDFEAATADPQGFDFVFVEQRRETEFANFGFDPAKAMRDAEIARIDAELDLDNDDDFDEDDGLDDDIVDDDDNYHPFDDDFDDDDMDDDDDETANGTYDNWQPIR